MILFIVVIAFLIIWLIGLDERNFVIIKLPHTQQHIMNPSLRISSCSSMDICLMSVIFGLISNLRFQYPQVEIIN